MKTNYSGLLLLIFVLFLSGCKKDHIKFVTQYPVVKDSLPAPLAELIFNAGFENTTFLRSAGAQYSEFRGVDESVPAPNDWILNLIEHPNIGVFRIYYEQGDSSQRFATIVADPVSVNNKVLNFKILVPHIDVPVSSQYTVNGILFDKKGRVQAEMYGNNGMKEIYQSVRLFLPEDFNKFVNSKYPGSGDWITLFEFWNNAQWISGATYPFRFGINIDKGTSAPGSPLYFKAEGQKFTDKFVQIWYNKNSNFPIPIGQWMTLEYYIKEGNKGTGRFYFAVTPAGGIRTIVFNLTVDTCHPDDPKPDGLSEINPLKLYASNNIINQMNSMGGTFQIYWDDFKFWKNKRP